MLSVDMTLWTAAADVAAGGWTPAAMSALAWWDVSAAGSVFQDTAGATAATTDGQSVARVNDLSGNGYHWVQATSAKRPLLRVSGAQRWLEFDGTDDSMEVDDVSAWNFGTANFVTAHAMRRSDAGWGVVWAKTDAGVGNNYRAFINSSLLMALFRGTDMEASSTSTLTVTDEADVVGMWGRDASSDRYELNGSSDTRAWSASGTGSTSHKPRLFADDVNVAYFVQGRWYGGIVDNAWPTAGELARMKTWLGGKAGLSL